MAHLRLRALRALNTYIYLIICSFSALAIEGHLPPEVMDKINAELCTLTPTINAPIGELIKKINNTKLVVNLKIGIDPSLVTKRIKDFKMNSVSFIDIADKIAKEFVVKAFFVHDFIYIGKSLPPGITPTGIPLKGPSTPLTALRVVFPGLTPGASGKIAWLRKNPQECEADLKPIALYIISDRIIPDPQNANEKNKEQKKIAQDIAPAPFDKLILDEDIVVKALKEFTCIKIITSDANGWPAEIINLGKHNAALLLLTADLRVVNHWEEVNAQITPESVVVAAAAVAKANQAARDKLAKKSEVIKK